jgi:hypothetical protein
MINNKAPATTLASGSSGQPETEPNEAPATPSHVLGLGQG